jgi:hypothetical protein
MHKCQHCNEEFHYQDECPLWDNNGFTLDETREDHSNLRLCNECADKHFYPELHIKPTGINHDFLVANNMLEDLSEIRKPVITRSTNYLKRNSYSGIMLQALEAYDIAEDIWSEYNRAGVDPEVFERGVRAFIKMNELMGKIRSKKNLETLSELRYDIAWEYMFHPLFKEWEEGRH